VLASPPSIPPEEGGFKSFPQQGEDLGEETLLYKITLKKRNQNVIFGIP